MRLPIREVVFYKHGLGYFVRQGDVKGRVVQLDFPRTAMDDVLKSLVVVCATGQVLGIEFETPQDRNPAVSRQPLQLSTDHAVTDLVVAFRGREISAATAEATLRGRLVGLEADAERPLIEGRLVIFIAEDRCVRLVPLQQLEALTLCESSAMDLTYCLRHSAQDEDTVSAVLRLSEGVDASAPPFDHQINVSYIAPAPAWRVSYQLLADDVSDTALSQDSELLLQGWGVFDNTLGEDLNEVRLALVAGMPVSFRYALHRPNTPERALLADDERTVDAPIEYDRAAPAGMAAMGSIVDENFEAPGPGQRRAKVPKLQKMTQSVEQSMPAVGQGADRGVLFRYEIAQPVSVVRGQSAMVSIVSQRLRGCRDLLYNEQKHPRHPVASWRFQNTTGLCLERGPVTVMEHDEYAGEAVLDFTPIGAESIVAFAVELGVNVHTERRSETRLAGLRLQPGFLVMQEYHVRSTQYDMHNTTNKPCAVVIEHARLPGYELFDVAPAVETTATSARWRVQCGAQARQTFIVWERKEQHRSETIQNLGMRALEEFLRDRFLDRAVFDRLKSILALYDRRNALQGQSESIEQRRQQVYARQTQIQNTLAPLTDQGEEGPLRARLVGELNRLEDRLTDISMQAEQVEHELLVLDQQIGTALESLRS